jgi:hypothetical protein
MPSTFSFSGCSVTIASVVSNKPEIEAAFCNALRFTLVGSATPAFTKSKAKGGYLFGFCPFMNSCCIALIFWVVRLMRSCKRGVAFFVARGSFSIIAFPAGEA